MDSMKFIMDININGNTYKLYNADVINDDNDIMGYTVFTESAVYIKRMKNLQQMIRSVKHELTHVWLYEYGHNQHDEDKTFNCEDICEIVACSNDWVNKMVNKYISEYYKIKYSKDIPE